MRFQSGRESAEIASPSSSDRSRFQSLACGPQDSNLQPRDSRALAFPRGLDYLILPRRLASEFARNEFRAVLNASLSRRPGSWRGLLLGLTPLVSEPSWPPKPGQAWLRIALPRDRGVVARKQPRDQSTRNPSV